MSQIPVQLPLGLEDRIPETGEASKDQAIQFPEPKTNWGIRKTDLKKLGYSTLENIFYGMKNLDIPTEMLDLMNPDEILAKYAGVTTLKRYSGHSGQQLDYSKLCTQLDSVGYRQIHPMVKNAKKIYSAKPGEQKQRLNTLDARLKQVLVDSFTLPYKPSKREEPWNPKAFGDPNIDGRSKTVYVNAIYSMIESMWKKREYSKPAQH